jgi:hypothetical protein
MILTGLTAAALSAQAVDINVDLGGVRVQTPGGTAIAFGSRDNRGYYWDGGDWRDRAYWESHNDPRGEKYYTCRQPKGAPHPGKKCPPGQAKKGNC